MEMSLRSRSSNTHPPGISLAQVLHGDREQDAASDAKPRGNKQLECIDAESAKRRWREDLPLNLKEMAAALETSYDAIQAWRRQPGFPIDCGKIFRSDFELWRRARLGLEKPYPNTGAHPPHSDADISRGSASTHGSPTALPRRAALLAERAGLRR